MSANRRLVCTLGLSPAVVTEALDKYFFEEGRPLSECILVHTNEPAVAKSVEKLRPCFVGGRVDGPWLRGATYVRTCPGEERREAGPLDVRFVELPFPDLVKPEEHRALLHQQAFLIAEARQQRRPVEVSLAGGRKTESAVAAIAAQFFGAERVVHVLPPQRGSGIEPERDRLHYPLKSYEMVDMPLMDLSGLTYTILDKRRERITSPEHAGRILDEFMTHIPALAREEAERLYGRPAGGVLIEFERLTTRNARMAEVLREARSAASSDSSILILGETGIGKKVLAQAIHRQSSRRKKEMLHASLAGLPANLIESELFGHEKGAFSGADRLKRGLFEQAEGSTLFLDEIGKAPPAVQSKILVALEERRFRRVGGDTSINADFRLISAMNEDPSGPSLLPDLYYRVAVVTLDLPPLRKRLEDIPGLAGTFFQEFCAGARLPARDLKPQELDLLLAHDWPGNVRELRSAIEQWVVKGKERNLPLSALKDSIASLSRVARKPATSSQDDTLRQILEKRIDYTVWRSTVSPKEIVDLILSAKKHYAAHVKHALPRVELEDWTAEHFGIKDLNSDLHKARRRKNGT